MTTFFNKTDYIPILWIICNCHEKVTTVCKPARNSPVSEAICALRGGDLHFGDTLLCLPAALSRSVFPPVFSINLPLCRCVWALRRLLGSGPQLWAGLRICKSPLLLTNCQTSLSLRVGWCVWWNFLCSLKLPDERFISKEAASRVYFQSSFHVL